MDLTRWTRLDGFRFGKHVQNGHFWFKGPNIKRSICTRGERRAERERRGERGISKGKRKRKRGVAVTE